MKTEAQSVEIDQLFDLLTDRFKGLGHVETGCGDPHQFAQRAKPLFLTWLAGCAHRTWSAISRLHH